jgi:uncharacterized protein (DUF2345 family)
VRCGCDIRQFAQRGTSEISGLLVRWTPIVRQPEDPDTANTHRTFSAVVQNSLSLSTPAGFASATPNSMAVALPYVSNVSKKSLPVASDGAAIATAELAVIGAETIGSNSAGACYDFVDPRPGARLSSCPSICWRYSLA